MAKYRVVGVPSKWSVEVDGIAEGEWETKEAAYEAAVAAGSNAIKKGYPVEITVPAPRPGESAIGGAEEN